MILTSIVPLLEFISTIAIQYLYIWGDRGWNWSRKTFTNSKTIAQYANLVSGCENFFYDRYSNLTVIIWVNMMYGVGLPLLFPLTLFSIVLQYIIEKLLTVYYYRKSPMLDEKINHNAYTTLKWAVHVYTFTGYWMLSNKQIFGNDVTPINRKDELEITNHSLFNIPYDHAYPLLVCAILILFTQLLQEVFIIIGRLVFVKEAVDDYLSYEELLPFPESLYEHDLDTAIAEEEHVRSRLGYSKLNEKLLSRLHAAKDQYKTLSARGFKKR